MKTLFLCLITLSTTACVHIPPGGVKSAKVSFGMTPVFSVTKDINGANVTENKIKVDRSTTAVQILTFTWSSTQEGFYVVNPPQKP